MGGAAGYDGGKKIKGRKRHIVVDTLGLLLAVAVTAANLDDGTHAPRVLGKLHAAQYPRLDVILADNKYHKRTLEERLRSPADPFQNEGGNNAASQPVFSPGNSRLIV